jgi:hypothetical protein
MSSPAAPACSRPSCIPSRCARSRTQWSCESVCVSSRQGKKNRVSSLSSLLHVPVRACIHILPRTPKHTFTYTTYIPTCTHRTKKTRAHTQTRTHARMHRQTDRQTDTHTHIRATSEQKRNESHEKHRNGPGSVSRPTCTIC